MSGGRLDICTRFMLVDHCNGDKMSINIALIKNEVLIRMIMSEAII